MFTVFTPRASRVTDGCLVQIYNLDTGHRVIATSQNDLQSWIMDNLDGAAWNNLINMPKSQAVIYTRIN